MSLLYGSMLMWIHWVGYACTSAGVDVLCMLQSIQSKVPLTLYLVFAGSAKSDWIKMVIQWHRNNAWPGGQHLDHVWQEGDGLWQYCFYIHNVCRQGTAFTCHQPILWSFHKCQNCIGVFLCMWCSGKMCQILGLGVSFPLLQHCMTKYCIRHAACITVVPEDERYNAWALPITACMLAK